jgi:hypothetical protein
MVSKSMGYSLVFLHFQHTLNELNFAKAQKSHSLVLTDLTLSLK